MAYENRDYTHLSEEEKQKIELIAQAIRNKAYGIDVRESIALAIEWVNREYKLTIENNILTLKEFENAKSKVSTLELDMDEFIKRYSKQIAGNTSLDETIDARVDATGVSHTTLKDRLDKEQQEVNEQLVQKANNPNLVDKLEKLIQFRGMYTRTASDGSLRVGVGMNKETNSVVEYRFLNNEDNLLLLRGVYSGVEDTNYQPNVTMVGAFNTNTERQYYTTEVGAKLTFKFTGDKLFFKRRTDSRGGMWKFTLSTGEVRYASCFSEPGGYEEDLVFANLANTTHHAVAEFIGADPDNSPTATPRGYFYQSTIGDKPFRQANALPINETTAKEVVGSNSVPDYAIQGRKAGTSTSFEWSPVHGVVSGVSVDVTVKIKADGVVLGAVAGQIPQIDFKEIKNFELSQFFRVVNPNAVGDGKLWEHTLTHIIDERNPFLTIQNVMNLLQNVEFGSGYFGMLPSRQSTMNRLVLNNGLMYAPLTIEAQEDYYGADVTSAAFTGEYAQGVFHGVAIDMSSPEEIYNLGKNIEPSQKARISFRPNDVAKVYFTSFRGATAPIGERFTSQNRICAVSGVQFPNTNLGV